jgi:hypothetical protein
MRKILTYGLIILLAISCNRVKNKTKGTINKGGETVGKSATEFFDGVSEGVEKSLECEIVLSSDLTEKGLRTGKFSIENDSSGEANNVLALYVIFDKDFKDTLSAKVFDKTGLEYGRTKLVLEGTANNAGYFDFHFDKRVFIESRSRIEIE